MNVKLISYSLTGNNDNLASSVAAALGAEHIRVTESKRRTMASIFMDMLLNRTPAVSPGADIQKDSTLVILAGPVWLGKAASPLRAYLKQLPSLSCPYAFISISGGADGVNAPLEEDLVRRAGRAPVVLMDMHIADLLPRDPKPTREDTAAYRLTASDLKELTSKVTTALQGILPGR